MNILELLVKLRDNLMTWVTNNLHALEDIIDEKSDFNNLKNKPNIDDDDNGELLITDEKGNIIAKIDSDGIHTTDLETKDGKLSDHLNNDDIHVTTEDKDKWDNHTHDFNELDNKPGIEESDDGEFYLVDPQGNIIFKVNYEGTHSTEMTLKGVKILETLLSHSHDFNELLNKPDITTDDDKDFMLVDSAGNIIAKIDENGITTTKVTAKEIIVDGEDITDKFNSLHDHENKSVLDGITEERVTSWDNKSDSDHKHDFSEIENSPIEEDNSGEYVITDTDGNIIAKIDANGFHTTKVTSEDLILDGEDIKEKFNNLHTHENKEILDNVTQELLDDSHDHSNKEVLDAITSDKISEWDSKSDSDHTHDFSEIKESPIQDDDTGEYVIVDEKGNIIARIDSQGLHVTDVEVNGYTLLQHLMSYEGHTHKYDELDDKPFYDNQNVIFEFDGDTESVVDNSILYAAEADIIDCYLLSESILSIDEANKSTAIIMLNGTDPVEYKLNAVYSEDYDAWVASETYDGYEVCIIGVGEENSNNYPGGIYVGCLEDQHYVKSIFIRDLKQLDEKFIPDSLTDTITTVQENLESTTGRVTTIENNLGGLIFSVTEDGILEVTY